MCHFEGIPSCVNGAVLCLVFSLGTIVKWLNDTWRDALTPYYNGQSVCHSNVWHHQDKQCVGLLFFIDIEFQPCSPISRNENLNAFISVEFVLCRGVKENCWIFCKEQFFISSLNGFVSFLSDEFDPRWGVYGNYHRYPPNEGFKRVNTGYVICDIIQLNKLGNLANTYQLQDTPMAPFINIDQVLSQHG